MGPPSPPDTRNPLQPLTIYKRKRAGTQALLGDQYEDTNAKPKDTAIPEINLDDYTVERVKKALSYAVYTLRNTEWKLSPLGERAMQIYKEVCATFLKLLIEGKEGEIHDKREVNQLQQELISQIWKYKQTIQYRGFMVPLDSPTRQEMQDNILHLKRIEFYARYGNLLANICKKLKSEARAYDTTDWQHLYQYWSDINTRIKNEKEAYKLYHSFGNNGNANDCHVTLTVWLASRRIGLHLDDTLAVIDIYAERNIMHKDLCDYSLHKHY